MRLAHVTTVPVTLNFFRGHIGYLKAQGFDLHAISSPGEMRSLWDYGREEGIEVHEVPMQRRMAPFADVRSLFGVYRVIRRLRPTIVHSHSPKAGLIGTLAARAAGVPVVYLSIFGLAQMGKSGFSRALMDTLTRLACCLADRVWCDSASMRNFVAEAKLCNESKLFVLGNGSVNGVDATVVFNPADGHVGGAETRAALGISPEALVIGFVGRLAGDKGMRELADSWRVLRVSHPTLHLLLVGPLEADDPIPPEDELLFRQDCRVHMTGPQQQVAPFFATMNVFVMPSYREGFGVTNIEAAAMRLPVVATRIPGCVDSVVDGVTGTLVPAHDAGSLCRALHEYLEDEPLREAHGNAGRARALADFRPEDIWTGIRGEYEDAVSAARTRQSGKGLLPRRGTRGLSRAY